MTGPELQKLYDDLTKLSVFIQDYLAQLSKDENVDGSPFEEKLKNFLVPYSDLQINEYMKGPAQEDPKHLPQVAHELMTVLIHPGAPLEENEFYEELKIIHDLLHAPGKLLPVLHSNNIVVKGYDFNLFINQLTKINLLRHLCQDFAIIDAYRQNNKESVDAHFPTLKNLSQEWLSAQFNAIKVIAANPHQHVGKPATISEKAFPEVGGVEVQIAWQAGQPAVANPLAQMNPQAAAPFDQQKAPVAPVVPKVQIPQPGLVVLPQPVVAPVPLSRAQRAYMPNARRRDNDDYNLPRVYQPYVPPAARFNAPRSPRSGRFWLFALLASAYLTYHYHGAMTGAISASLALGKSMATAGFAFLASASWPVLMGIGVLYCAIVIKGLSIIANRSHAQGRDNVQIRSDFAQRLRDHLGQKAPPVLQDEINPQPDLRFSPRGAAPVHQDNDHQIQFNQRNRKNSRI